MYEARQNKERVSRTIAGSGSTGVRQRRKSIKINKGKKTNIIAETKFHNTKLAIQREPIYLNKYYPQHPYRIGFSTFTSHSRASHNIISNMSATEAKGFPVLWAGHTMLSSKLGSRFPHAKDYVRAQGYWTRSGSFWQSVMSSIKFLWNKQDTGVLNNDDALLRHPDIETVYVYVSKNVFDEWNKINTSQKMIYTHSPDIDSNDLHNCVSFALNAAWHFTMNMLAQNNLDAADRNAMVKLNEFIQGAVITLRENLSQPDSSRLRPGLQGYFLKFIKEEYKKDLNEGMITDDDIAQDLWGHNDDFAF